MIFSLKYDLKWGFSDILILSIIEFDILRSLFIFKKEKLKLKNTSLSEARTHKSIGYFRAEIQKYFVRFLVQVKIAKSPYEIN